MKLCPQCNQSFKVTNEDRAFYQKISPTFNGKTYPIPDPKLCPDCRQQRRLSFRNERNLHHRKSDLSGKQIITMYSTDKPYKVYDQEEWWSDQWSGLDYGREFDFSKTFSEQFKELFLVVPRINLINKEHENAQYCNFAIGNKNSYMLLTSANCEDSLYCNRSCRLKNCVDCTSVNDCELCYECLDSEKCFNGKWLQACTNCSDCEIGYNLKNCKNCFACTGLRNKEYCIGNVQMTKEQYEKAVIELKKSPHEILKRFNEHKKKLIRKFNNSQNTENSTGDDLFNTKNCQHCFSVNTAEDCHYMVDTTYMKSAYDANNDDHSELIYNVIGSEENYHCMFHDICWYCSEIMYCSLCFHSKNLFGCIGLKKNQYCILNKQYSKEEYEALVAKIIDHMISTGEWGEYFPVNVSPFAYNETVAQDTFSLSKEEVLKKGWNWREETESKSYKGPHYEAPANIAEVQDEITQKILTCEVLGNPYKIIPQELKFYRQMQLPIPRRCPEQRYRDRLNLRNPRKLWSRTCMKCQIPIETTYSPERPEVVYCEQCYLKEVY